MRVLVVGGGGREHALCWAIAASPLADAVYCAPGNAGIAETAVCLPVAAEDIDGQVRLAREHAVDLVVIGPEAPLVAGLIDRLDAAGLRAFGPSAAAARLKGSKGFAKELCVRAGIPTAGHAYFTDAAAARADLRRRDPPYVVKADGLAAGKGVVIADRLAEAEKAVDEMLTVGAFGGDAGTRIVIEEFLDGEEASFFALVDGANAVPLPAVRDYEHAGDGDRGADSRGMGACSPAPAVTERVAEAAMDEILRPAVAAMAEAGTPYKGVLGAGLTIVDGAPRLREFNIRFGDPGCQVLMARLASDLLPALVAATDGELDFFDLRWLDEAALTVVMVAGGDPGGYARGGVIDGLDAAAEIEGVTLFHAGTARAPDGSVRAAGGRVLGVTATGPDLAAARARAYRAVDAIDWPGGFCRRDIGERADDDSA